MLLLLGTKVLGQSASCGFPTKFIPNPENACLIGKVVPQTEKPGEELTTFPDCFVGQNDDVWFRFEAPYTHLNFRIKPAGNSPLTTPCIAVYSECDQEPLFCKCPPDPSNDGISFTIPWLSTGHTYYIRVDGYEASMGQFELCTYVTPSIAYNCKVFEDSRTTLMTPYGAVNNYADYGTANDTWPPQYVSTSNPSSFPMNNLEHLQLAPALDALGVKTFYRHYFTHGFTRVPFSGRNPFRRRKPKLLRQRPD